MKIVESDMTREEHRRLISKANQGYYDLSVDETIFSESADVLLDLARQFPLEL